MKKVLRFFAETYYELLLNKTIVFIVLLIAGFVLWMSGDNELLSVFGKIGTIAVAAFTLFCWLHGWILYALDRERWKTIRAEANGGKPFLRTKPALVLAVFALLLLITTVFTLFKGDSGDFSRQWILSDVLAVVYLVCFFLGPNRLPHISSDKKNP